MSFGLGHGRQLDPAPGLVAVSEQELPPLPDDAITNPRAGWVDPREWFVCPDRPFHLEIGSGKGTFLMQQAALDSEINFLGVEWAREFFEYAADRIRRRDLRNVRMLGGDATELLRWRIPTGIVEVIHLYFSDPWPKARHHKKRVVRDDVLAQCHRVLAPGGELRIVTDHADYWAWMQEHFARWCGDGPTPGHDGPNPAFLRQEFRSPESADGSEVVGTNFERKYRLEGRPFHACVLRRSN